MEVQQKENKKKMEGEELKKYISEALDEKLDKLKLEIKEDIKNFKDSMEEKMTTVTKSIEMSQQNSKDALDKATLAEKCIGQTNDRVTQLEYQLKKESQARLVLETQIRRINIKFCGIDEEEDKETPDACEQKN